MEKYNWIKAYYTTNALEEKEVFVRQEVEQSETFVDDKGNKYHISDLDFTKCDFEPQIFNLEEFNRRNDEINQKYQESQALYMEMLSKMDANAIADHKAKIDERQYWRKLRGDIALEMLHSSHLKGIGFHCDYSALADKVNTYFTEIYEQDKEFFKDK